MPSGALPSAHVGGRVSSSGRSVLYSWPGLYFEGSFTGTGVGVVLSDNVDYFDVDIDGAYWGQIVTPRTTTVSVTGLSAGTHSIRLAKRTESESTSQSFGGFVAQGDGEVRMPPPDRARQIELIGDSFTAGYGNESPSRECDDRQITQYSNANASFGALTARHYDADYQINAYSGLGLVRNYNGKLAGTDFRAYYDRNILANADDVWVNPGTWRPQVVVIGLGVNDFSTPINVGEPWTDGALLAAYQHAYHGFIAKIRGQYGVHTMIVVSATYLLNTTTFATAAQQVVAEENEAGDSRVRYWYYDGLADTGCQNHPSAADHQLIASKLIAFIDALGLSW
jgi:lysophospholipase L1-like esterase